MLMVATNLMQSLMTYPLGVIADAADQKGINGRGLQSSTFQLNLSLPCPFSLNLS